MMVSIMEEVEILRLGFEMPIASKPLGPEESSIIGIIEALHGSVPPRFSDWDKDCFDSQKQTESEDDPKGTGVAIAPPEAKLVVDLKKVGHSQGFPTADQTHCRRLVVFASLGMEKDARTVKIHDIEYRLFAFREQSEESTRLSYRQRHQNKFLVKRNDTLVCYQANAFSSSPLC